MRISSASAVFAALLARSAHAQSIVILDPPSGQGAVTPWAISRDGRWITGSAGQFTDRQAIVWRRGGTVEAIEGPASWRGSEGRAVSDEGTVVGHGLDVMFTSRAFTWSPETGLDELGDDLGACGTCPTQALDINASGSTIVGSISPGSGGTVGYRLIDGVVTLLGPLEVGIESAAVATSESGSVVAGNSGTAWNSTLPFLWTEQAGIQALSTGSFFEVAVRVLSDDGSVAVGSGTDASGTHPLRWEGMAGPAPLPLFPGATWAAAEGVSTDGSVVVGSQVVHGAAYGCIWTAEGVRTAHAALTEAGIDLTGWEIHALRDVSGDGSAVCGEGLYDGVAVGFVAYLTSPCIADYNGAGEAGDVLDFLDFFQDFSDCDDAPAPCGALGDADVNGDTVVDILDFLDFIDAFGDGC